MTTITPTDLPSIASTTRSPASARLDPNETRVFAAMMGSGQAHAPSGLQHVVIGMAQELDQMPSLDEISRNMLKLPFNALDPAAAAAQASEQMIRAMTDLTRVSFNTSAAMGIAQAATGFAGSLLKTQT